MQRAAVSLWRDIGCSAESQKTAEAPKTGGRYHERTLQDAFNVALKRSGVGKYGTIHTFRHCFATHLYEDGHNLLALKKLLGHVRIDTTA